MYHFIRNLMFKIDPEASHELALDFIGAGERLHLVKPFIDEVPDNPVNVMGLEFPNPVGLAAGLDKNGDYLNGLGQLGFGFIEIGTVTPRAQPGNPQPRLFRLEAEQAIINRMGFNNKGVDHLVSQVEKRRYKGILGINLGKNKDTPEEHALDDYRTGLQKTYELADYLTINISSPNTPGLRNLQFGDSLKTLLAGLKQEQCQQEQKTGRYVPIAVKIAPDLSEGDLVQVAGILLDSGMDGVIATNTTISREEIEFSRYADEAGGLSGAPLTDRSTAIISALYDEVGDKLPIIGVGGIMDGASAVAKMKAGAKLVQIYTGFIYQGPGIIGETARAIAAYTVRKNKERSMNL